MGDDRVECYNINQLQKQLWEIEGNFQSMETDNRTVILGNNDVYAVDINSGTEKWQYNKIASDTCEGEKNHEYEVNGGFLPPRKSG